MGYSQKGLEKLFAGSIQQTEPKEETAVLEPLEKGEASEVDKGKVVIELPIAELTDYPKQLFKPYTAEKLDKLAGSIKENGVIYPLIVRSVEGTYQIVCGHNRRSAARQLGYNTVPCIVEDLTDDEADIRMVETNLQVRDGLLPSEKAFAYKMKLDAIKHQGVTSRQVGEKLLSVTQVSKDSDDSERQIQRYIRLTYLIPELLTMVDDSKIAFNPAVELSYLSEENQKEVHRYFFVERKLYIGESLAKELRERGAAEPLSDAVITSLLPQEGGKTIKQCSRLSIPTKPLKKLLPADALSKDIEQEILNVLIDYFRRKKEERES